MKALIKIGLTLSICGWLIQPAQSHNQEYNYYLQRLVEHHSVILSNNDTSNRELQCLARNIFFEARGEPTIGQLAVANVTINRSNITKSTICQVVYKRGQFQWTAIPQRQPSGPLWDKAKALAWIVINQPELVEDVTNSSHHFHSGPKPQSFRTFQHTVTIGNHRFYKNREYEELAHSQN